MEEQHHRIGYISGGLSLKKLGRMRERWETKLSRAPSKASARDAEQHSNPGGSSLVTLANLELPQYSPTSTSG